MPNTSVLRAGPVLRITGVMLGFAILALSILAMPVDSPRAGAQTTGHDVSVEYVQVVGPAAVNLSDTNGRFMWVMASVRNRGDHEELVGAAMTIHGEAPDGCSRVATQVMPGSSTRILGPGVSGYNMWRVRFECHAPAVPGIFAQTVNVTATHLDVDGDGPHTGDDLNTANDSASAMRQIIVR